VSLISITGWRTWAAKGLGLRHVLLPIFRRVNLGNITISHHWTGDPMVVHSFIHKSYWYYGRVREYDSMAAFQRLLKRGDIAIDIGAHIGYTAVFFGNLVGSSGHVYAFEPGPNNLEYTRGNCANCRYKNISLVEMAVSSSAGHASLYVETLSGQNDSLLREYEGFTAAARSHGLRPEATVVTVQTIRLDSYVEEHRLRPALVKIDVEGAEAAVLSGAANVLGLIRPVLMVEVTQRHSDVTKILLENNYRLFAPAGAPIDASQRKASDVPVSGNVFAIPAENRDAIDRFVRVRRPN
jgi:FkbM family methyltransferase